MRKPKSPLVAMFDRLGLGRRARRKAAQPAQRRSLRLEGLEQRMLLSITINDVDELQLIGNDANYPLSGDYVLACDIDATATAEWNWDSKTKRIRVSSR